MKNIKFLPEFTSDIDRHVIRNLRCRYIARFVSTVIVMAFLISCANHDSLVGGGSEGEARIACVVNTPTGDPAVNALVRLLPSDYVKALPSFAKTTDAGISTKTDINGKFEITGLKPGSYSIEINNGNSACLVKCTLSTDDEQNLGTTKLVAYSGISGLVDTQGFAGQSLYVSVEGLDRLVLVSADGSYLIGTLPSGVYTIHLVALGRSAPITKATGIVAQSGHTSKIVHAPAWPYSQRLYINTTPSGASISENLIRFPLLIRPFELGVKSSQCKAHGEDIRFVKEDGTSLPYEIEQWDTTVQQAAVWVRVDTIYGNTSDQWIDMRWGCDTALSLSDGSLVFDADSQFAGVWHFTKENFTVDATKNHNNAIDSGTTTAPSPIGSSRYYNGASYMYIPDTATLEPRSLTISAWVSVNIFAPNPAFTKIVHKGVSGHEPKYGSYALELRANLATGREDLIGFQITNQDSTYHPAQSLDVIAVQQWMMMTGTFDAVNGSGCFYLNGVLQQTFTTLSPIDYYSETSFPVSLGCQFGSATTVLVPQSLFTGCIDEVRISPQPRIAAWILLEYENQRAGSTVVFVR